MTCHNHSVDDFDIQLQVIDLELSMLTDGDEVPPYNASKVEMLEEKKIKLLNGKRFHQNAARCYWYWIAREEN